MGRRRLLIRECWLHLANVAQSREQDAIVCASCRNQTVYRRHLQDLHCRPGHFRICPPTTKRIVETHRSVPFCVALIVLAYSGAP